MVKPKKHLGQHFLHDTNIAAKIVSRLSAEADTIVEIGAGTGILTGMLWEQYGEKLVVVEVDAESVRHLQQLFPDLNDRLLHADILQTRLDTIGKGKIAVIGNFPYNISSQIFFHLLKYRHQIEEVVCMIQKEVAERLSASAGNKTYGILSVLLQAWFDIEYCFTVNEQVFSPPPKVKSAVIRLKRNQTNALDCNETHFHSLVKKAFNQRRKTLRNSLREWLHPDIINDVVFNKRPEQLSVQQFVNLSKRIEQNPRQT